MKRSSATGTSCPPVDGATGWMCQVDRAGGRGTSRRWTPRNRLYAFGRKFTTTRGSWSKCTRNTRWIRATRKCRIKAMTITKQTVANKIAAYLRHEISLAELVDWAEDAMMEGEFTEHETAVVSGVVSRLGVADVRAFGLAWEDCEQLLRQLGYAARVDIVAA